MIPASWTPNVPMLRIIGHWTAGGHRANSTDKRAYHVLVEGDGNVIRGTASIEMNSGKIKDGYAAHTLNCNTGSIGASMCGMAGAVEVPFNAGAAPLTRVQFDRFCELVAELCRRYGIPVTPKTVLFHAEVQSNLGIKQRNKWDIARLPFDPAVVGAHAIGELMRSKVRALLAGEPAAAESREPVPDGAQGRVLASSLKFRGGPGESYRQTGSLPRDTVVEVERAEPEWLYVKTPAGYLGWVARDFVEIFDGPPVEAPTKPDPRRAAIEVIRKQLDSLEGQLFGERNVDNLTT